MTNYRRAPGVLAENIDGNLVLVDANSAELVTLNGVGTLVWEALPPDGTTVEQLVGAVLVEYPDAPTDAVSTDVQVFLDELTHAGLVSVSS